MSEPRKSEAQLLSELASLRRQVEKLLEQESRHRQMEDALRESEEKYRTLFGKIPIGLGIAEMDGALIDFNDAMLKPGGYTREEIFQIGNVAELYFDPTERARVLEAAQKQGFLHNREVLFKRKDGTPYQTLLSLSPIQYEGRRCWRAMVEAQR